MEAIKASISEPKEIKIVQYLQRKGYQVIPTEGLEFKQLNKLLFLL